MDFSNFFPMWDRLSQAHKDIIQSSAVKKTVKKGTVLHGGFSDCSGLFLVASGMLRAYILSEEGKEVIAIYSHNGYQWAKSEDYDSERAAQEMIQSLNSAG